MQLVRECACVLAATIDFHRARADDALIILQRTALFSRDRVTFVESRPLQSQNSIYGISIYYQRNSASFREGKSRVVKSRSSNSRMEIFRSLKILRGTLAFFFFEGREALSNAERRRDSNRFVFLGIVIH